MIDLFLNGVATHIQTFEVVVVTIIEMFKLFGLNPELRGGSLHVLLLHALTCFLHVLVSFLLYLPTIATEVVCVSACV